MFLFGSEFPGKVGVGVPGVGVVPGLVAEGVILSVGIGTEGTVGTGVAAWHIRESGDNHCCETLVKGDSFKCMGSEPESSVLVCD